MQIATMISEVRRALGKPNEAVIHDADILMEIWQVVSYYRALLNLTNEAWVIGRWDMNIPAGPTTEMNITADGFEQAFLIHSIDDNNPYHIRRTVDIIKLEQLSMYWHGPDTLQIGGSWWSPHVAMGFAPFNESGVWKMAWLPAHLQACTYRVYYTRGASIVPPVFDDTTAFPIEEQNFFLIADIAQNLFASIADPAKGLDERQKLLALTAKKKCDQWLPVFEAQRWEGFRREQPMRRRVFGQSRASNIRTDYK